MQRCKIPLSQILQRLVSSYYQGQVSSGVASNYDYTYALSDTVPFNKFWVVLYASVYGIKTGVQFNNNLWVIYPGPLPNSNLAPFIQNHNFFQGDVIGTIANGPPVGPYAIRVDEGFDQGTQLNPPGSEMVMLKSKKLLVPSGCTLMAYGGAYGFGNGGAVNTQYALQVAYAEFSNDEVQSVIAPVVF